MASQTLDTLVFQGSLNGTVTVQAQPIAGNAILQLPNINGLVGQNLQIVGITGDQKNILQLGFVTPATGAGQPVNLSQLTQSGAALNEVIQWNGTAWVPSAFVPGAGTVTSVALSVPAELSITGSPITTSGTLALSWASGTGVGAQAKVIATPSGGGAGAYAGRVLVASDIPALAYLPSSTQLPVTFSPVSNEFLTSYTSSTGLFTAAQVDFSNLSGSLTIAQINSKQGNGNKVQLSTGTTTTGDVVTYDVNGNAIDSGVLLSSLATTASLSAYALLASPTFTGTVTLPSAVNATGGSDLIFTATSTNKVRIATATGVFDFFGTGGGMTLASQNSQIAIDASGNISLSATGGSNLSVNSAGGLVTSSDFKPTNLFSFPGNTSGTAGQLFSSLGTDSGTAWISQSSLVIAYSQLTGTPTIPSMLRGSTGGAASNADKLIQSDRRTLSTGTVTITLATPYADTNYYVTVSYDTTVNPLLNPGTLSVNRTSASQFVITSSSGTDGSDVSYIAVGSGS